MTCVENKQNLVIEGVYLLPEKINELEAEYLNDVITFYLGFSTSYIEQHYVSKILKFNSVIEDRNNPDDKNTIESYIIQNRKQKEICIKSNAKYFEIQNDYEVEMACVYTWIDNKIKSKQMHTYNKSHPLQCNYKQ